MNYIEQNKSGKFRATNVPKQSIFFRRKSSFVLFDKTCGSRNGIKHSKKKLWCEEVGWERECQLENQVCDYQICDNFNRIVIPNSQQLNTVIPIAHSWNHYK